MLALLLITALLSAVSAQTNTLQKRVLLPTDIGVYSILGQGTVSANSCKAGQGLATAQLRAVALGPVLQVCACVNVLSYSDPSVSPCEDCGSLGSPICGSACGCDCTPNSVMTGGTCSGCAPGYHMSSTGTRCDPDPVCPSHSSAVCSDGLCICVCDLAYSAVPGSSPLQCVLGGSARARLVKKWQPAPAGHCPTSELSCPLASGGYECVLPNTLEHCGGCNNNCNMLPGVKSAGCNDGICHTFSCKRGYHLMEGTCVSIFKKRA